MVSRTRRIVNAGDERTVVWRWTDFRTWLWRCVRKVSVKHNFKHSTKVYNHHSSNLASKTFNLQWHSTTAYLQNLTWVVLTLCRAIYLSFFSFHNHLGNPVSYTSSVVPPTQLGPSPILKLTPYSHPPHPIPPSSPSTPEKFLHWKPSPKHF